MNETLALAFTGDIGFDKHMEGRWADDGLVADGLLNFLHSADHVCINIEGPIIAKACQEEARGVKSLLHAMDPRATRVFDRLKADIWNLCNNHMMDEGSEGVAATLAQAKAHNARTIGAGMNIQQASEPLYFDEAGGIGLFSVGYRRGCKPAAEEQAGCFLWHEMALIEQTIKTIKAKCRWCVMVVHGGEEFTALPSPYTRERYLRYLEMGADVIVSHHPHVPMNYETIGSKVIFYSLGNFIFDTDYQRSQYNTDIGVVLKLNFSSEAFRWEARGLRIDRTKERILDDRLPAIFTEVPESEYRLLAPLAAKMLVQAYKRQQIYWKPEEYLYASEEKWHEHFWDPGRSGRVIGEGLDFQIICPLADEAERGEWQKSSLEAVKEYILKQM